MVSTGVEPATLALQLALDLIDLIELLAPRSNQLS